jgi:hypothetical protein
MHDLPSKHETDVRFEMSDWLMRTECAAEVKVLLVRVKVVRLFTEKLRSEHTSRVHQPAERQWPVISQRRLPPRCLRLVCKVQINMCVSLQRTVRQEATRCLKLHDGGNTVDS